MDHSQIITFDRKQLYEEIWEISVAGVARKYELSYTELLRRCKEENVPIPPSGYWAQLRSGKNAPPSPLPTAINNEVRISREIPLKRGSRKNKEPEASIGNSANDVADHSGVKILNEIKEDETHPKNYWDTIVDSTVVVNEGEDYREVYGKYNIYDRGKLYEEVWSRSVVEVAKEYGVSDVAIHKVCKSLEIPVPPRGYWAKIRAGHKAEKPPLLPKRGITTKKGAKTYEGDKIIDSPPAEKLLFLDEVERKAIMLAATEIKLLKSESITNTVLAAHKSRVAKWNEKNIKKGGSELNVKNDPSSSLVLAGVVSEAMLPRAYRILDTIFCQVERLGGKVEKGLSVQIRGECIDLYVVESQDKIDHSITKEEAWELLKYEDEKRKRYSYATKPKIRKYDYVFNGRLRITIESRKHFRDTEKVLIEDRLGEILIELFEMSEKNRVARIAKEEKEQKEKEEARLRELQRIEEARIREERQKRYTIEVNKTLALVNMAQDYDIACKIRALISSIHAPESHDGEIQDWVNWAKGKADWFDPVIAKVDDVLGKREHEKDEESKSLKPRSRWW